jgi:hypothetical protein
MKRKLSLVLAVAVLVCMVFTVPTCAAPAGQDVTVTTEVSEPVWNIVVPTTMPMAIDPFALHDGSSQVYSPDFTIVNKSQVAVKATATVTLTGAAVFKDNAAAVTETNTDKLAFVQAKVANSVNVTTKAGTFTTVAALGGDYFLDSLNVDGAATFSTDAAVDVDKVEGVYNASSPAVNLGTAATKVEFALQKADYLKYYSAADKSTTAYQYRDMAADKKGVASWRFVGKLNSYAAWQAADISATVAYSFAGLTPENYAGATLDANGHQFINSNVAPTIPTKTFAMVADTAIVVPLNFGAGTLAATGVASVTRNGDNVPAAQYTVANSKLTINATYVNALRGAATNAAIVVKFNDSANTTETITLTY